MTIHNFNSLKDLPLSALERIKKSAADAYAVEMQKRWNAIASILFYQEETKKLVGEK